MKCPLIGIANPAEWRRESPTEADCLKEDCAWWQPEHGHCVITSYLETCEKVASYLKSIDSKLPLR